MPIIRRKDHVLLHMRFFAGSVGCGWLQFCSATLWGVSTVEVAARAATSTVLTPHNVALQNCNQPHPTLPAKNLICSNTWSFLLMMGI